MLSPSYARLSLASILLLAFSTALHAERLDVQASFRASFKQPLDERPGDAQNVPHLAILVPFRGWHRRLADGLEGIHRCLRLHHDYTIFVVEQVTHSDLNFPSNLPLKRGHMSNFSSKSFKILHPHFRRPTISV